MSSLIFFFCFIPLLAFILLAVNLILAPHNPYQEKNSAFECGFHSFLGQNRTQFSISFFIFALLFLLFDLEILLVYPYIVSAYTNGLYGLIIMLIFFIALTSGFAFELGKKALSIESKQVNTPSKVKKSTILHCSMFFLVTVLIKYLPIFNYINIYMFMFKIYFYSYILPLIISIIQFVNIEVLNTLSIINNLSITQYTILIFTLITSVFTTYIIFVDKGPNNKKAWFQQFKEIKKNFISFFKCFILMWIVSCFIRGFVFNVWDIHSEFSIRDWIFTLYLIYSTWLPITYITRLITNAITYFKHFTLDVIFSGGLLDFTFTPEIKSGVFNWKRLLLIFAFSTLGYNVRFLYRLYMYNISVGYEGMEALLLVLLILLYNLKHFQFVNRIAMFDIFILTPNGNKTINSISHNLVYTAPIYISGVDFEPVNTSTSHGVAIHADRCDKYTSNNKPVRNDILDIVNNNKMESNEKAEFLRTMGQKGINQGWTDGWQISFWFYKWNTFFRDFAPNWGFEQVKEDLERIFNEAYTHKEDYNLPMFAKYPQSYNKHAWFADTLRSFPYRQVDGEDLSEMSKYQHLLHVLGSLELYKKSFVGSDKINLNKLIGNIGNLINIYKDGTLMTISENGHLSYEKQEKNTSLNEYKDLWSSDHSKVHPLFIEVYSGISRIANAHFMTTDDLKLKELLEIALEGLKAYKVFLYDASKYKSNILKKLVYHKIEVVDRIHADIELEVNKPNKPCQILKHIVHRDPVTGKFNQGFFDTEGVIGTDAFKNEVVVAV